MGQEVAPEVLRCPVGVLRLRGYRIRRGRGTVANMLLPGFPGGSQIPGGLDPGAGGKIRRITRGGGGQLHRHQGGGAGPHDGDGAAGGGRHSASSPDIVEEGRAGGADGPGPKPLHGRHRPGKGESHAAGRPGEQPLIGMGGAGDRHGRSRPDLEVHVVINGVGEKGARPDGKRLLHVFCDVPAAKTVDGRGPGKDVEVVAKDALALQRVVGVVGIGRVDKIQAARGNIEDLADMQQRLFRGGPGGINYMTAAPESIRRLGD